MLYLTYVTLSKQKKTKKNSQNTNVALLCHYYLYTFYQNNILLQTVF